MKPSNRDVNSLVSSRELEEIIEKPPIRLIRWGSTILGIILIAFLYVGINVRIPETVRALFKKDSLESQLSRFKVEINVKSIDFLKIRIGQKITFKYSNFQQRENEIFEGNIEIINRESGDSFYFVKAFLFCNIKANKYGNVPVRDRFEGTADIVVGNGRLIEKLFQRQIGF